MRGVSVIAMIGFHFTWDLGFFQLISYDIAFTREGRLLSHLIAGTFLFLVGVSLSLAHRNEFDAHGFLTRFAKIAGAAALVSIGTFFAMPEDWIFFGVLHCIALSSLLALPFLRAPLILIGMLALLALGAPSVINHPFFDQPALFWLGLNKVLPRTNDYVPLFPWFGVVLAGLLAGRYILAMPQRPSWTALPLNGAASRFLKRLGRYALPIYLLHQPVMMALLWAFVSVAEPTLITPAIEPAIYENCTQSCAASGRSHEMCDKACSCLGHALSGMKAQGDEAIQSALAICRKEGAF
jgi:uncharacterized membrane protein